MARPVPIPACHGQCRFPKTSFLCIAHFPDAPCVRKTRHDHLVLSLFLVQPNCFQENLATHAVKRSYNSVVCPRPFQVLRSIFQALRDKRKEPGTDREKMRVAKFFVFHIPKISMKQQLFQTLADVPFFPFHALFNQSISCYGRQTKC